jgi:hypothetical protein
MNQYLKAILSVLNLLVLMQATTANAQSNPNHQQNPVYAFTNVGIVDVASASILPAQTVLISGETILQTGPTSDISLPDGAIVLRDGGYLMPGLAEMHAHIPPSSQGEQYMQDVLMLYLSQGITTIRGMLGEPAHLDLRERVRNGEIPGPRILTSGPSFNGRSAPNPETGRAMVRAQAEAGYDLLKFHPGLSVETFEAVTDEARRLDMEFSGHISHAVGLERSLAAGKTTIDHLDRYMEFLSGEQAASRPDPSIIYFGYDLAYAVDPSRIEEAVARTVEAGVWNVPTNTLLENVFNPDLTIDIMQTWPGMEYMPAGTRSGWINYVTILRNQHDYDPDKARVFLEHRRALTRALHEGAAGLLLGADAPQIFNPPGFSAHRELALLVDAGLSTAAALATGTINVGIYLSEETTTGKIAPGFRADLITLDVNPLQILPFHEEIAGVMASGRYHDAAALQQALEKIAERVAGM